MSESLRFEPELDFGAQPADGLERAGFRPQGFEVFNWGAFHQGVWRMEFGGDRVPLTGDIGSGKSTLVDPLSTLLVPAQKVSYNKAAGAEERARCGHAPCAPPAAGHRTRRQALQRRHDTSHADEQALFGALRGNVHGQHVRMEQVRIGFGWVKAVLDN